MTGLSQMLPVIRTRSQTRSSSSCSFTDIENSDTKQKPHHVLSKLLMAAVLAACCVVFLKQSDSFSTTNPKNTSEIGNTSHRWKSPKKSGIIWGFIGTWTINSDFLADKFSLREPGVTHVLVTGGAGYIGSHAALRLLRDSYRVTIVDNLSRGNIGAIKVLQRQFPEPGRLQFILADLGDAGAVNRIFSQNAFDAVMHFAAVAYVGESTLEPLRYYRNITGNTLVVLEAMAASGVKKLIYSSTCATYGEPDKMPITEETPQAPINPYGKAKKMSEDIILDFSKRTNMAVMILRYFNVIGSDPEGMLGESPRPELREHGRISGACFDAALGVIPGLKVKGIDYETVDGTCIRDYIDVTDLVDAHVKALDKAEPNKVGIYNVGTGKGRSVKEFVEACKQATGVDINVEYLSSRRPGDYAEVYSNPSKINRELNWMAQRTDLSESLRVAWRWQQSHRNGYAAPLAMAF